jgi:outer membrane protein TolC
MVVAAPVTPAYGQLQKGPDYSKGKSQFPNLAGPYSPIRVQPPQLSNSPRVEQLIHDGKMELSLQDAIALALENNLDISIQRYTPWIAETDILRAKGGGATRGLAGTGTAAVLGAIPAQSFDPVATSTLSLDHRSIPVNNPFLAGTGVALGSLVNHTTQGNFGYSQAFHTGTGYAVTWNNSRVSTTSPAAVFNPSVQSSIFLSFTQQLLNGFGLLPNTRFIRIAKNSKSIADWVFAQQVITSVTQVENLYWELVFAREDVRVKQRSVDLAEKLYNDNKRQVEIGTLAPIEVVRAEAEVARTRQDLIVSQTVHLQQQTLLKNAITKSPMDPTLLNVEMIPTDKATQLPQIEIPPLPDAVKEALDKRPDVRQAKIDLLNRDISVRATRNALLPTLTLFGQYGWTGLSGNSLQTTSRTVAGSSVVDATGNAVPNLFVPSTLRTVTGTTLSGLGDAFDQIFNSKFPTYSLQLSLSIPIRNRPAQADSARAILEQRQAEERLKQLENSIVVDVRNAEIALQQNRARVDAAQKARILQEQTLDAEQKKFQLGASTIFFVIQAQRDLAQAESVEVRALVDLLKAKIDLDRALGRTLEVNKITISDAKRGEVERNTLIPGTIHGEIVGAREKY